MTDILTAVSLSMPIKTRLGECCATDNSEDEYERNCAIGLKSTVEFLLSFVLIFSRPPVSIIVL